jgi:hypothetical protein
MTHEEWIVLGYAEQWRAVVSTTLFKSACSVILEEIYRHRTAGDVSMNALQNQFKEGTYSAIHSLRALANPPRDVAEKIPKPWERKGEEVELPIGPQRGELIRE